ncbi:hypothetical protein Aduo_017632 [Ancylostoma duodenale]
MENVPSHPIPDDFMTNTENRLCALRFNEKTNELFVLDQLLLPHRIVFIPVKNTKDAFTVIRNMQVRGAPLIAVVGALGLLVEISDLEFKSPDEFMEFVESDAEFKKRSVIYAILKIYHDEEEENRSLVWIGYQEIVSLKPPGSKFVLMTICNTGSLATSSWGTALGVICALHQANLVEMVYALETRPYFQGMRLTATELRHSNVPFKIITDSMAAWTMKKHKVDAVLVGADQVALNGDTANKIGTYMLAVLAKHHHVPFYPVVPITTLNLERQSGDDIPIEERPAAEMLYVNGVSIGAKDTPVWNPAFDVTPADLITKIITDRGCFSPKDMKKKL